MFHDMIVVWLRPARFLLFSLFLALRCPLPGPLGGGAPPSALSEGGAVSRLLIQRAEAGTRRLPVRLKGTSAVLGDGDDGDAARRGRYTPAPRQLEDDICPGRYISERS